MAFIRLQDYYTSINSDHFDLILAESIGVSGDEDCLARSEARSIERAKEYLVSRFKTKLIFADFKEFDLSTEYTYGDRINFEYDEWEDSVYLEDEYVNYLGNVYKRNATTVGYTSATLPTNASFFDFIAESGIYYIAYPDPYDEDQIYSEDDLVYYSHEIYKKNSTVYTADQLPILPTDTNYFDRIRTTLYSDELTITGVEPSDSAWTFGDNRNQSIVECIVHMTLNKLHSLINPRNIPQLRRDNFSMAIEMLKQMQKGEIEADLPDRQLTAQDGYSIRFGSNEQTTHSY